MTGAERLAELLEGKNPRFVARLKSGYLEMAPNQFLPGYCILLAYPQVEHLLELSGEARANFLHDVSVASEAIKLVTDCERVNIAIYGNLDKFLHAHLVPRYDWEIPEYGVLPPMSIPDHIRMHEDTLWDHAVHEPLMDNIHRTIVRLVGDHREAHIID
jgi:diadenosine tetraphosphate (Ap4A) HIT family hydrolase